MTNLAVSQDPVPVAGPATGSREAAVRAIYDAEYARLTGYAWRLTGDSDLGREIAQEAFARLLSRWLAVRDPVPYLYRVVTNLGRDSWQSTRRRRRLAHRLEGPDRGPTTAPGPDVAVRDAVDRLPHAHRDAVVLYYYADLPVPEVAAALRRPPGTVKRLLSEARAMLAAALGDHHA